MSSRVEARVSIDALGRRATSYGHLVMLAARYARARLDGHVVVNRETGAAIAFDWDHGLKRAVAPGTPALLLLAVPAIPAMLRSARYFRSVPPRRPFPPHVLRYHGFEAEADVAGRPLRAGLIVQEDLRHRLFFDRLVRRDALPRRQEGGANPDTATGPADGPGVADSADRGMGDLAGGDGGGATVADASPSPAAADQPPNGGGSQPAAKGVPVVLPDGSRIPGLMSPVADLSPVAEAGRSLGQQVFALKNGPGYEDYAQPRLLYGLFRNVAQGGRFDYQREGNQITGLISGFTPLPQYRDVSNFNVGLFCQQAGLSLEETLSIAGGYAKRFSSNAKPDQPHGLDSRNDRFIRMGYSAGESGVFGEAAKP